MIMNPLIFDAEVITHCYSLLYNCYIKYNKKGTILFSSEKNIPEVRKYQFIFLLLIQK